MTDRNAERVKQIANAVNLMTWKRLCHRIVMITIQIVLHMRDLDQLGR